MRLIPTRVLLLLQQIVEANGSGVIAPGYPAEYLIGAALARPTKTGLVHTRKGLLRYRKEARRVIEAERRRSWDLGMRPGILHWQRELDRLLITSSDARRVTHG